MTRSLHTNTAVGAVVRLVDMGVAPFLLATALIGAVSQRLVRRLYKTCRRPFSPSDEIQRQCGLGPQHQLYQAVGCGARGKLGYRGRVGIQEIFSVTPRIRDAIQQGVPETELQSLAGRNGMINIFMDGVAKAVAGHTNGRRGLQERRGRRLTAKAPPLAVAQAVHFGLESDSPGRV